MCIRDSLWKSCKFGEKICCSNWDNEFFLRDCFLFVHPVYQSSKIWWRSVWSYTFSDNWFQSWRPLKDKDKNQLRDRRTGEAPVNEIINIEEVEHLVTVKKTGFQFMPEIGNISNKLAGVEISCRLTCSPSEGAENYTVSQKTTMTFYAITSMHINRFW